MLRTTELAHYLVRQTLEPGDWAVDATVGNGHDTRFLAELVGPSGRVLGFDVQAAALAAAGRQVDGLAQVTLVHASHETLSERLPEEGRERLAAVMFNLGYLPGADHEVTTEAETTLAGLRQALANLKVRGLVTMVLYPGHPGGAEEAEAVRTFAATLPEDFAVAHYARFNARRPAPELLAIERRR